MSFDMSSIACVKIFDSKVMTGLLKEEPRSHAPQDHRVDPEILQAYCEQNFNPNLKRKNYEDVDTKKR